MHIHIGADHRGFELKRHLTIWLTGNGHSVNDCGNTVLDPLDDYPDFAAAVAHAVAADPQSLGIVICGSGAGVSIAVNKVNGIRGALGITPEQVMMSRKDDHINVLALSSNYISAEDAERMVESFLSTAPQLEPRYMRRLAKIGNLERDEHPS